MIKELLINMKPEIPGPINTIASKANSKLGATESRRKPSPSSTPQPSISGQAHFVPTMPARPTLTTNAATALTVRISPMSVASRSRCRSNRAGSTIWNANPITTIARKSSIRIRKALCRAT